MSNIEIGDFCKIIDKQSGTVLCSGQVKSYKMTVVNNETFERSCITFDYIYFFLKEGTDKYDVVKDDTKTTIYFNINTVPKDYKVTAWREQDNYSDIYIENDINNLDKEVVNIVTALNKIEGLETTGSCSGHGERSLWVTIRFKSLEALILLVNFMQRNGFKEHFVLSTDTSIINNEQYNVMLQLYTKSIGEKAYNLANEFASKLEVLNDLLR